MVNKSQLVAIGIGIIFGGLNAGFLAIEGLPNKPLISMGLIMGTILLLIATLVASFSPRVAGWWLIIGGFTTWALLYLSGKGILLLEPGKMSKIRWVRCQIR